MRSTGAAMMRSINLALRFLLELCALAALAYWGVRVGSGRVAQVGLGIGAPLVAAIVWGVFVAPNAAVRLREPAKAILGLVILALAAAALAAAGQPILAAVFAVVAAVNAALLYLAAP